MIINQIAAGGSGGIDTSDATAYPEHILKDYTAYARGAKIIGTYVPQDVQTEVLLHMDATFRDERGHAVYIVGNSIISTAQSKFGGASGEFDSNGDYVYMRPGESFYLDALDFTIDFWIRPRDFSGTRWIFVQRAGFNSAHSIALYFGAAARPTLAHSLNGTAVTTTVFTNTLTLNTWQHLAVVRYGSTISLYINGVADPTTVNIGTSALFASSAQFRIGGISDANQSSNAFIDEFRLSRGVARWTTNFTPPTVPYGE